MAKKQVVETNGKAHAETAKDKALNHAISSIDKAFGAGADFGGT